MNILKGPAEWILSYDGRHVFQGQAADISMSQEQFIFLGLSEGDTIQVVVEREPVKRVTTMLVEVIEVDGNAPEKIRVTRGDGEVREWLHGVGITYSVIEWIRGQENV